MIEIPKKLTNDPIVDCVIELRFTPNSNSASDVIPGILFNEFRELYPNIVHTPESQIPKQARDMDVALKVKPILLLQSENGQIGIGDEVLQLTYSRPYPGWDTVKPFASKLFSALLATGMVESTSIRRVSIMYTNIINGGESVYDLSPLELDLSMGTKLERKGSGTSIRFEVEGSETVSVVQIQTGARAVFRKQDKVEESLEGLLVRVDTISTGTISSLEDALSTLENAHSNEKDVFFGLLKKSETEKLGPIWS